MRIFLDANILYSAAKNDGAIRQLLSGLIRARQELWVDGYVVEHARRNLAVKAPESSDALEALIGRITLAPLATSTSVVDAGLGLPEKDRPVLAAAIQYRCHILVTGDRTHFGRLYGTVIAGVEVLPPAALAERLM